MIGLYQVDKKQFPNIVLMKISQFYKNLNEKVEWYFPLLHDKYDIIYASKIFTFSNSDYITDDMIVGGTGFDLSVTLEQEIDDMPLDYTLYPQFNQAIGFLTRGCIRRCKECFVPRKEGDIRAYRDIEDVAVGRTEVILLDNNILACEHGIKQIEKIIQLKLKVDFNQGLDARLIDRDKAILLSKVKWLKPLRLACDSLEMIEPVYKAIKLLREHNCKPDRYFVYVLVKDIPSALVRVNFLRKLKVDPFAQPYLSFDNSFVSKESMRFARWVNNKAIFNVTDWSNYTGGK